LNDIVVIEDSTKKRISLDLPEIDDINFSKFTTFETPRSFKPLELLVPESLKLLVSRPFKFPEPENKPLEPIFKPPEKPIKPIDSLDPDKI